MFGTGSGIGIGGCFTGTFTGSALGGFTGGIGIGGCFMGVLTTPPTGICLTDKPFGGAMTISGSCAGASEYKSTSGLVGKRGSPSFPPLPLIAI